MASKMDELIEKQVLEEMRYNIARKKLEKMQKEKNELKEEITDDIRSEIYKKYDGFFNEEYLRDLISKSTLKEIKDYLEDINSLEEYENIKKIVKKGSD